MIEGAESNPRGELDLGIARDTRVKPCPKWTWCTEVEGHAGSCVDVPRGPLPAIDYGPNRSKR